MPRDPHGEMADVDTAIRSALERGSLRYILR